MIAIISVLFGCMLALLLLFGEGRKKFSRKAKIALYSLLVLDILIFTSQIIPLESSNMDLYRYYHRIDVMRSGGLNGYLDSFNVSFEWFFTLIVMIVSRTPFNVLAPIIACVVCFSIFGYIFFDYYKSKDAGRHSMFLSLGLFFLWLPYFQIIDNLRSPMAMAFVALGTYLMFKKDKKSLLIIASFVAALLMHISSAIMVLLIILIVKASKFFHVRQLFLVLPLVYSSISAILMSIPIDLIHEIGSKMQNYTAVDYNTSNLFNEIIILKIIVLFLFIILIEFGMRKMLKTKKEYDRESINLVLCIMYFCLGSAMFPTILGRYTYILAFFTPQFLYFMKNAWGKDKLVNLIIWVLVFGVQYYAFLKMSRLGLNGIDLQKFYEGLHLIASTGV